MQPIIEVENLSYVYANGVRALEDVSLKVARGQFLLIAGRSGSGKSTLAKILAGLSPQPIHGELRGAIYIDGQPIHIGNGSSSHYGAGLVLQSSDCQILDMSPAESVADVLLQVGSAHNGNAIERAIEILQVVDLAQKSRDCVFDLSDGERQKLALAEVLALDSSVLVLDEPLAYLDARSSIEFVNLVEHLSKQRGKTIVLFEHRVEHIAEKADRIALLDKGRILLDEPSEIVLVDKLDELPRHGVRPPEPILISKKLGMNGLYKREQILLQNPEITITRRQRNIHTGQSTELMNLKNVSFWYEKGKPILRDISFSIQKGDRVAVVGENGSGKTTLALLMAGLLKPKEGKILFRGLELHRIRHRHSGIGLVFHPVEVQLIEESVIDEVRDEDLLESLGLRECASRHPLTLSKGEKLRTAIASILSSKQELIIVDEPTVGQDSQSIATLFSLIENRSGPETAVIFLTHDQTLVANSARKVLRIDNGNVTFFGNVYTFFEKESKMPPPFTVEFTRRTAGKIAISIEEIQKDSQRPRSIRPDASTVHQLIR